MMDYCNHIKSISDLLVNIGVPVPQRNFVTYAINELSQKFPHIKPVLWNTKPFPTFLEMRSILTLEERAMIKDQARLITIEPSHQDNSSSPTVLNTEHQN